MNAIEGQNKEAIVRVRTPFIQQVKYLVVIPPYRDL